MGYTQINFQDSPSTATPVNAENLNKMDQQYANVANDITPGATDVNAALLQRYGVNDTGWLSTGVLTAATGWAISSYIIRRIGNIVMIGVLNFSRTGAAITVPADGNIVNSNVAAIDPAWVPPQTNGALSTASTGPIIAAAARNSGFVEMSAVTSGAVINTGSQFSLSGVYFI